jgi:hypothetical protein
MTIRHHHSLLREGFIVGVLGAFGVALWFLILDLIAGRPFFTPSVLGQVLLFGRTTPDTASVDTTAVAAYTCLHFGVFVLFGIGVTQMVHWAIVNPLARFALLMIFAAFEVFFYGFIHMLSAATGGLFPLWTVLGANTVAALLMAAYLWVRHPSLRRRLQEEPLGA